MRYRFIQRFLKKCSEARGRKVGQEPPKDFISTGKDKLGVLKKVLNKS